MPGPGGARPCASSHSGDWRAVAPARASEAALTGRAHFCPVPPQCYKHREPQTEQGDGGWLGNREFGDPHLSVAVLKVSDQRRLGSRVERASAAARAALTEAARSAAVAASIAAAATPAAHGAASSP